jgi:pyruvate/2-oxoglutarate dehydrogenase complex dihydrolipoamide dehydrogenase (E3) component
MSAEDAFENPASVGGSAVILGAGFTGVELGLYLHSLGKCVEIVEMRDALTTENNASHAETLQGILEKERMTVNFRTRVVEITSQGVRCETPEGERFFEGEAVICALGRKPLRDTVLALSSCAPRFYQIGDCRNPRDVAAATGEAWSTGRHIGRY